MVGNYVDHLAQAARRQRIEEALVSLGAAQFVVDPTVIDDVVAVGAAGRGLQVRRCVDVADTQLGQVAGDVGRRIEPEAFMEL